MQEQAPFRISAEPTRVELVAKYFRGLGDETRLAILNLSRTTARNPANFRLELSSGD